MTYRLDGNLEPEAFSTDAKYLFVIQYLPPSEPSLYRVAELELKDGDVYPVISRVKSLVAADAGHAPGAAAGARRPQLYTLYSSQPAAYAEGYDVAQAGAEGPVAFVHVLNLEAHWAFCLPLPKVPVGRPGGRAGDGGVARRLAPVRGRPLARRGGRDGARRTRMSDRATVPFATDSLQASATISPDGEVLYVGTGEGLVTLDATTFEVRPVDHGRRAHGARDERRRRAPVRVIRRPRRRPRSGDGRGAAYVHAGRRDARRARLAGRVSLSSRRPGRRGRAAAPPTCAGRASAGSPDTARSGPGA